MSEPRMKDTRTKSPVRPVDARALWEEALRGAETRAASFTTLSGAPLAPLYGPADVADLDPERDLGYPGQFPFTRGVHPTM